MAVALPERQVLEPKDKQEKRKKKARQKLVELVDKGSFVEFPMSGGFRNPLGAQGYSEKKQDAEQRSGEKEAIVAGTARIGTYPCVVFILEPLFMMGSMGSAVGEMITCAFEYASKKNWPVVSISASGGARVQEGVFSLMQMAKTAGAVSRHGGKGLLYVSVISDPTLGGVSASYASLGDIIIAEQNARFGFTGKRIIEETTRERLPHGFQTAEFAKEHGMVDLVVAPEEVRQSLISLLKIHCG